MISTAKEGGTIINYSDRFTITGMTGTTTPAIQKAVTALGGTTAGPPTVNSVTPGGAVAPVPPPAADTPAAGNSVYNIPYGQQTGLTKYAPMQGVPPTKITNKGMTPQYPTSAVQIAVTFLPKASIVTTLTEPMTFSVNSHPNTVCLRIPLHRRLSANSVVATRAVTSNRRHAEVPGALERLNAPILEWKFVFLRLS